MTAQSATSRLRARCEYLLLFVGLGLLLVNTTHRITGDGKLRFRTVAAFAKGEGLLDNHYSAIGPLFSTPLWFIGDLFDANRAWVAHYNWLVLSLGVFGFYWLLRDRIDRDVLRRFLLLLVFGSMFAPYQTGFYGETFSAMLVGLGALAIYTGRERWGAVGLVLGVANQPAGALGLVCIIGLLVLERQKLRYLVIPIATAALIMGEAWLRRGSPLTSGHESFVNAQTIMPLSGRGGFEHPMFFGAVSILFSMGKGLFFFAPGLLLAFRPPVASLSLPIARAHRMWVVFVVGLVLVYSKWWAWYGGFVWGPRFFLLASIPASFALALHLSKKRLSPVEAIFGLLIVALSLWVSLSGILFDQQGLRICLRDSFLLEHLCWYTPEYSTLFHPFIESRPLNVRDSIMIAAASAAFLLLAHRPWIVLVRACRDVAGPLRERYLQAGNWKI